MTSTQIITAGVLPAAGGNLLLAVKHSFASGTNAFSLEMKVTNGAIPEGTNRLRLKLACATSAEDGVAATVAALLEQFSQSRYTDLKTGKADVTYDKTDVYAVKGAKLYVWLESPVLPAAGSVSVWVNEL